MTLLSYRRPATKFPHSCQSTICSFSLITTPFTNKILTTISRNSPSYKSTYQALNSSQPLPRSEAMASAMGCSRVGGSAFQVLCCSLNLLQQSASVLCNSYCLFGCSKIRDVRSKSPLIQRLYIMPDSSFVMSFRSRDWALEATD